MDFILKYNYFLIPNLITSGFIITVFIDSILVVHTTSILFYERH